MLIEVENYINEVCSHIYNKRVKEEIKEEIRCHIEEKIELLQLRGVNETEATRQVILEMGDADTVAKMMSEIHHQIPFIDFKKAMTKLIFGFELLLIIDAILLSSKQLGYFFNILIVPGVFLISLGLFQLKECNKYLKLAYYAFFLYLTLRLILLGIKALPIYYEISYTIFYVFVSAVFAVVLFFLGRGLIFFITKQEINRCCFLYIMTIPVSYILPHIVDEDAKFAIFLFVIYVYIIYLISDVRNIVLNNIDSDVKPLNIKYVIVVATISVMYLITPILITYYANSYYVKMDRYVRNDINDEGSIAKAASIRNKLKSVGISDAIINDLSISELMKYESVERTLKQVNSKYVNGGLIETEIYTCILGNNLTRCIFYFKWIKKTNKNYIDYIEMYCPTFVYEDYDSETLLLLCDKEGKTFKIETISTQKSERAYIIKSVSYRNLANVDNQRGYFAVNINQKEALSHLSALRYFHPDSFFIYPYIKEGQWPGFCFSYEMNNFRRNSLAIK